MTNHIETWLLILALFLPRLGLLIAYFSHQIPANTIPLWGDVLLAIFVPRVLMLIYIATNLGYGGWFLAHAIALVLAWGFRVVKYSVKDKKS